MRMPSYATLSSFVFSLLITSAVIPSSGNVSLAAAGAPAAQIAATAVLNGLRAEGMGGGAELSLPSPAATPAASTASLPPAAKPAPVISPELMQKMLKLIASKGGDQEFIAPLANAVGLGAPGQPWSSRSFAFGDPAGLMRGFYISRGTDQDIVVTNLTAGKNLYCYRAHRDGTVTAAFIGDVATHAITPWNVEDAQKGFNGEIAVWTQIAAQNVTVANN